MSSHVLKASPPPALFVQHTDGTHAELRTFKCGIYVEFTQVAHASDLGLTLAFPLTPCGLEEPRELCDSSGQGLDGEGG